MHTARILHSTDSRMIGGRIDIRLLAFPGFCRGIRIPWLISFEHSLLEARRLKMFAICSNTISGANLSNSMGILSQADDLLIFWRQLFWVCLTWTDSTFHEKVYRVSALHSCGRFQWSKMISASLVLLRLLSALCLISLRVAWLAWDDWYFLLPHISSGYCFWLFRSGCNEILTFLFNSILRSRWICVHNNIFVLLIV